MIALLLQEAAQRPDSPWWGILVPALIFIIAFGVTLMLYRHFSKEQHG